MAKNFNIDGEAALLEVKTAAPVSKIRLSLRQLQPLKAYEEVQKNLRMFEPARESHVLRVSFEDSHPQRAAAFLNGLVSSYLDHTVKTRADEGARTLAYLEKQLPALKADRKSVV